MCAAHFLEETYPISNILQLDYGQRKCGSRMIGICITYEGCRILKLQCADVA